MTSLATFDLSHIDRQGVCWKLIVEESNGHFRHQLNFVTESKDHPALSSVAIFDGEEDSICPRSLPLQQVARESHVRGDVIMGVGMAGRNHWSATFRWSEAGDAVLEIECACRLNQAVTWLGVRYDVGATFGLDAGISADQSIDVSDGCRTVKLVAGENSLISSNEAASPLEVRAAALPTKSAFSPTTITWSYRLVCQSAEP